MKPYSHHRKNLYRSEFRDHCYCPTGNAFNGKAKGVLLAIADAVESVNQLVDPEHALRIAMARQ